MDARAWGRVRFFFFTAVLLLIHRKGAVEWALLDPRLFHPVGVFGWWSWSLPSVDTMKIMGVVWPVSLCFAAAGFLTRLSVGISFCCGFYLIGMTSSFGHQFSAQLPLVFALFLMNFVNSGKRYSIDALLKKKFKLSDTDNQDALAVWPLRLMQILWVCIFLFSALTKLRESGLAWIFDGTLQYFLIENSVTRFVELRGLPWENAGLWLAHFPAVCALFSALVLLFELSYPLALLGGRWALFYIYSALFFLAAVYIFMGVEFSAFLPLLAFWLVPGSVWNPRKN